MERYHEGGACNWFRPIFNDAFMSAESQATRELLVTWVQEHGPYLYRQAFLRIGQRELAEDLVQETFLTASQCMHQLRELGAARSWLLSILRNKILDHVRKYSRESLVAEDLQDDDMQAYFDSCGGWRTWFFRHWAQSPESSLENRQFIERLEACLQKLPSKMRPIFVASTIDEIDSAKICENFGISSANLWTILFRGRLHLRHCLETTWFKPMRKGER